MRSLLLPSPLHRPEDSLAIDLLDTKNEIYLLPLDVATVAGGILRKTFSELAKLEQNLWYLPASFLRETSDVTRELRKSAIQEWRRIGKRPSADRTDVFSDDPAFLQNNLGLRGIRRVNVAAPSAFDWAKEIFPSVLAEVGELRLRDDLTAYGREVSDYAAFPWEGLRFFAGFLRSRDAQLAACAALDWARVSALYSPQDEVLELQRLPRNEVILNPTIQFHRGSKQLIAIGRFAEKRIEKTLNQWDALVLDEVMEGPRRSSEVIVRSCELGHPHSGAILEETFDRLVSSHILLQGRSSV